MAGSNLESIASAPRDSDRRDQLLTMKAVGARALPMLQSAVASAQIRAEAKAVKVIEPIATQFEKNTLAAFEELLASLRTQESFYTACNSRGLQAEHVHGHWQLSPFEHVLLSGGGLRTASLRMYIDDRRDTWNLTSGRKKEA